MKKDTYNIITEINLVCRLDTITIDYFVKGFLLNYQSKKYIISLHHNLPIIEPDNLIINCVWNELLILENTYKLKDTTKLKDIKDLKFKLPLINSNIYIMNNKIKINLNVDNYPLLNINNLPTNPRLIYIQASFLDFVGSVKSLSGSPVFNTNNQLVGILCKQERNSIYILPTYYIIQTLTKSNNIFSIEFEDKINSINNNLVKDNLIYHRSINTKIPLDVYFVLCGDDNNEIIINKNINLRYIIEDSIISNERYIIYDENNIVVNATLLIFLKLLSKNNIEYFIEFVKRNLGEKILFSINSVINFKNKISKKIQYNKCKYILTMYCEN